MIHHFNGYMKYGSVNAIVAGIVMDATMIGLQKIVNIGA